MSFRHVCWNVCPPHTHLARRSGFHVSISMGPNKTWRSTWSRLCEGKKDQSSTKEREHCLLVSKGHYSSTFWIELRPTSIKHIELSLTKPTAFLKDIRAYFLMLSTSGSRLTACNSFLIVLWVFWASSAHANASLLLDSQCCHGHWAGLKLSWKAFEKMTLISLDYLSLPDLSTVLTWHIKRPFVSHWFNMRQ